MDLRWDAGTAWRLRRAALEGEVEGEEREAERDLEDFRCGAQAKTAQGRGLLLLLPRARAVAVGAASCLLPGGHHHNRGSWQPPVLFPHPFRDLPIRGVVPPRENHRGLLLPGPLPVPPFLPRGFQLRLGGFSGGPPRADPKIAIFQKFHFSKIFSKVHYFSRPPICVPNSHFMPND